MNKFLTTLLAAIFAFPAFAEKTETEDARPLTAVWTADYDSEYVLYGYRQKGPLLGTDIYLGYPVTEKTTLWGGSWFGIIPNGTYREVDVYIGADYALTETVSAGLSGSVFRYIEVPFSNEKWVYELAGHISYQGEHLSLSLREHVDTKSDGTLSRAIASYTQPIAGRVALKGIAEFGYAFGYYTHGNRANHALLRLELPVAVTDSIYVTPFVARSIALDAIKAFEEDETFGGASISWTL